MSTIVCIHGIPGSSATWSRVAELLQDRHHVRTPALLGFDRRPTPTPTPTDALLAPAQARHLLAALDDAGVGEIVLVGHDFGGPVAAHLWALAPDRVQALALFATNAFPDTPVPFPLSLVRAPVVGGLAARLLFSAPSLAMMLRQGVGTPEPRLRRDDHVGDRDQRRAIRTIFTESLRRIDELYAPVAAALARVTVPTLVGWGDRDPFFPVDVGRRTAGLFPDARFRLYDGAGHFLPEERPAELAADIELLATRTTSKPSTH